MSFRSSARSTIFTADQDALVEGVAGVGAEAAGVMRPRRYWWSTLVTQQKSLPSGNTGVSRVHVHLVRRAHPGSLERNMSSSKIPGFRLRCSERPLHLHVGHADM